MPATIIAILLAGDSDTVGQIDPVLEQLQIGMFDTIAAGEPAPEVFCYYERKEDADPAPVTKQFRLASNTFTFLYSQLTAFAPPQLYTGSLSGNLESDVSDFIARVLAESSQVGNTDPIRVICAAHGHVSKGISGRTLLQLLLQLFTRMDDSEREVDSWRVMWDVWRQRLLGYLHPPCALSSSATPGASFLTLDQLANVLGNIPSSRLKTLILHTCQLSSVETIKGLELVPHHMACASELKDSPVKLSLWFPALLDSTLTDEQLTQACFDSLRNDKPNAWGRFSSQRTADIDALLAELDALGTLFLDWMGDAKFDLAVGNAQSESWGEFISLDLARFCEALRESDFCEHLWLTGDGELRLRLLSIETQIHQLQLSPCVATGAQLLVSPYEFNRGINVVLPSPGYGHLTQSDLPADFVTQAPDWWKFVEQWSA